MKVPSHLFLGGFSSCGPEIRKDVLFLESPLHHCVPDSENPQHWGPAAATRDRPLSVSRRTDSAGPFRPMARKPCGLKAPSQSPSGNHHRHTGPSEPDRPAWAGPGGPRAAALTCRLAKALAAGSAGTAAARCGPGTRETVMVTVTRDGLTVAAAPSESRSVPPT